MPKEKSKKPPILADEALTDLAVDYVLAMMRSASTDNIKPIDWWPRAKSALIVSSSVAETWPQMMAKMGAKLQIDSTVYSTADTISSIGTTLKETGSFERFRFLCERDALYIVAMAQAKRAEQREQKENIDSLEGSRDD